MDLALTFAVHVPISLFRICQGKHPLGIFRMHPTALTLSSKQQIQIYLVLSQSSLESLFKITPWLLLWINNSQLQSLNVKSRNYKSQIQFKPNIRTQFRPLQIF